MPAKITFSDDFFDKYENLSPVTKITLNNQLDDLDDNSTADIEFTENGNPLVKIIESSLVDGGGEVNIGGIDSSFDINKGVTDIGSNGPSISGEISLANATGKQIWINGKTGEAWEGNLGVSVFDIEASVGLSGINAGVGVGNATAGGIYYNAPAISYDTNGDISIKQLELGLDVKLGFGASFTAESTGVKTTVGFVGAGIHINRDDATDSIQYLNSEKDFLELKLEAIQNSMPRIDNVIGPGSLAPSIPTEDTNNRYWYEEELAKVEAEIQQYQQSTSELEDELIEDFILQKQQELNSDNQLSPESSFVLPDELPATGADASDAAVLGIASELESNINLMYTNLEKLASSISGI